MESILRQFDSTVQLHQWAHEHLIFAESIVKSFVMCNPYIRIIDIDPETGQHIHKIRLTEEIPPSVALHTFDLINALRACLDYAIYASSVVLVCPDPKNTKFPFGSNVEGARNNGLFFGAPSKPKRRDTDPAIIERVIKFQPYTGGDRFLTGLNTIRNMKHHRILAPVILSAPHLRVSGGRFVGRGPFPAVSTSMPIWDAGKNELELFRSGTPETNYNLEVTVDITFGQGTPFAGASAITVLTRIFNKVGEVLAAVEAETMSIYSAKTP
jgi:hypothetical protein